ncbi:TPA: hypothetical protein I8X96_004017 [Raoultella ornithinolytica]|nr:hypothetical protein [Raoultella ornithinolytica]
MAELRAGGLAIIISSRFSENVGKTVRLVRFIGEVHHFTGCGIFWEVEAMAGLRGTRGRVKPGSIGMAQSKNLMPIDGDDFSDEDQHQKEREHA